MIGRKAPITARAAERDVKIAVNAPGASWAFGAMSRRDNETLFRLIAPKGPLGRKIEARPGLHGIRRT